MCGRYTLRNPEPLQERFNLENLEKRYNIAPGQRILVVDDKLHLVKWGFTPYWAEKPFNLINARAETLLEKPSFKNSSRCLVPADGWYEWKEVGGQKVPYFFNLEDKPFFFAGVYGGYRGEVGCAIVTTEAVSNVKIIHSRMPCIINADEHKKWLGGEDISSLDMSTLNKIKFFEVSTYVNNPQNDNPKCLEL